MILRGSLFKKYVIYFVTLVTVTLAASGAISVYFTYQEHKAALLDLQREKATAAAVRIETYALEIAHQIEWILVPQIGVQNNKQRQLDFHKLLRQVPAITEIVQLDRSGIESLRVSRLGVDGETSTKNFSKEAKFLEAKGGKTYFSPVYFSQQTEPYVTIAMPNVSAKDGVTVAEVNLKFIVEVISAIQVGGKGHAYVVDARGNLIAHPDISLVLQKSNLGALPQIKAALDAKGGGADRVSVGRNLQGGDVLSTFASIRPLGWHVFVEQPLEEAFAPLYVLFKRTGLLLLGGIVLSVIVSLLIARRMVEPIRIVTAGAARIGTGNLTQRIAIHTGDELEALADQFNDMAGKLEESYAGLEKKVEDRTAELSESLEQQTATSEVLRVISGSTTDLQPVFEVILERSVVLCAALYGSIFRYDGVQVELMASNMSAEGLAVLNTEYPAPASRKKVSGRVVLDGQVIEIPDREKDAGYGGAASVAAGYRSLLGVPLLRDGKAIGAIVIYRAEPGEFTPKQISMMKSFADQAVIAIENVRLFKELESRTEALTLSGEQLAAVHAQVTTLNTQLQSENLRMGSELEVTRRLQLMLLPGLAELQSVKGLDIAGHMQPAVEVGGDYYDVLQHDGRVKIGIGDVTGHGLESGVVMVMTQAIVRALLTSGETDHVRFLNTLNQALFGNVQRMGADKNLTLCLLDYAAGVVKVSGQHEEMIVVRRDGTIERVDTMNLGFPVGLVDQISEFIGQTTITLQPGDGIVLYTDGITEAENMANQQYGLGRLCAVVSRCWSGSADSIKEAVVSDIATYIGLQTVYDDITLVVLKQQ